MNFKNKIFLLSIVLIIIFVVYRYGFFIVFMLFGNERKVPPTHEELMFLQKEQILLDSLKNDLKCDKVSGSLNNDNGNGPFYYLDIFYEQCDSLKNYNKIENRNIVISRQLKKKCLIMICQPLKSTGLLGVVTWEIIKNTLFALQSFRNIYSLAPRSQRLRGARECCYDICMSSNYFNSRFLPDIN